MRGDGSARPLISTVHQAGPRTIAENGALADGESWQGSKLLAWIAWHCVNTKGRPAGAADGAASHCTAEAASPAE
jgi:hypothetical protein